MYETLSVSIYDLKSEFSSVLKPLLNPLAYTDVPETAGLARSINP